MALTGKQVVFVEEYLVCWNATEAARAAGYKGDSVTLASMGWENLRKPQISEAIGRRLAEKAMSADEVLMRLADHARGNMGDFWTIPDSGDPVLDLTSEETKAKLHLVKKLKVKRVARRIGEVEETTTEIDFELYDAQAALVNIGKHHKLFADKLDVNMVSDVKYTSDDYAEADRKSAEFDRELLGDESD